ncbi:MAG: type I restriction enzyme S subunit [Colwellia sp.]
MSELPKGWVQTKFTDTLDVNGGTQPPKSEFIDEPKEGYIRLLQIRDFGKKPVPTYIPDNGKRRICKKEDILIGRYGASIGRICTGMEGAFNVALARVAKPEEISSGYLKHFLQSHLFQDPLSMLSRSAQNGFNKQDLAEFNFPLAPENEQTRIANKLDSILAKVDVAQARLDKIPNILKRFRQSVLAAATSGELIGENVDTWNNSPLVSLLSNIADCPHSTPKWTAEGKICVRTTAFKPFNLDLTEQKKVSQETYIERTKRLEPKAGDILYSREGAILGVACQIPEGVELCLGQRMLVMRAGEKIDPRYLTIVLNSPLITDPIKSLTIGNAAPRINMSVIKNFNIPYPCLKKQKEIVRRFEAMFENAGKVEKKYLKAKDHTNRLTQSILAKAFRGELVAQDEDDEPASKLLARIKEQTELLKPRKKAKK